ncbi:MAG TPA: T9SS type A sorting domain-containing protein [Mariniphaga anaerophila]|uniref:T9SS type A sorting domain-containing protein n=1 Tax=Mariniphaga anaerophila TaxID=1484053 RepID=A0A831PM79_9BACT|nr:T9SS type A sorting domain-containing protein [Mariniphaga anaerophila]
MKFTKFIIAVVFCMAFGTAFGQYLVPLYAPGNSGETSAGGSYTLLSVTGQNGIGPVTGNSYHAYFGLLAPVRYVLTDADVLEQGFTRLYQNYPNPFKDKTTIPFEMSRHGKVTLTVFDVLGQPVEILLQQQFPPGKHLAVFDAERMKPGLFFYQLKVDDFKSTKTMVLTK